MNPLADGPGGGNDTFTRWAVDREQLRIDFEKRRVVPRPGGVVTVATANVGGRDVAYGGVAGVGAWLLGYVFTYVIAASDIRNSGIGQILEVLQGDPATYEMVGWVFYNAHFVSTVVSGIPVFNQSSVSFVGGDNGLTPLLYVIPIALLLAAGLAMARLQGANEFGDGIVAGLLVVPGYLVAAIAGAVLFGVEIGSATVAPDLMTAVALGGVAYPALCAGVGGAIAGATGSD